MESALKKLEIDFSPTKLTNDYYKYKKYGPNVLLPKVKKQYLFILF